MSEKVFKEYQTFHNLEQAREFTNLLDKSNIEYDIEKVTPVFDPAFTGNTMNDTIILKLLPSDFSKADKAYADAMIVDLGVIDKDYYLFSFSNEELMEVIIKKDEWNDFDYVLALKLLKERGREITPDMLDTIRKQRLADLSRHKPFPLGWIIVGYILAVLGGILGVFIGLMLLWDTKRLPDRATIFAYDSNARSHGKIIFTIGLVMLILTLVYNMKEEFESIFNR